MQRTLLPLLALMIFLTSGQAQSDSTALTDSMQWPHAFLEQHLIKVGPGFIDGAPYGLVVQYETGLGHPNFSLLTSVRYMSSFTAIDPGDISIPQHIRIEFQPRYYPIDFLHPIYLGPLVNINSNGELAGGAIIGWQAIPWGRLPIDLGVAIQSRTATENYASPIFLRFHLGIGIALPRFTAKEPAS